MIDGDNNDTYTVYGIHIGLMALSTGFLGPFITIGFIVTIEY